MTILYVSSSEAKDTLLNIVREHPTNRQAKLLAQTEWNVWKREWDIYKEKEKEISQHMFNNTSFSRREERKETEPTSIKLRELEWDPSNLSLAFC